MGAAGAINVIFGKVEDGHAQPERRALYEHFKELEKPIGAAQEMKLDDVIDPRDTRLVLLHTLDLVAGQPPYSRRALPPKKRGISPV